MSDVISTFLVLTKYKIKTSAFYNVKCKKADVMTLFWRHLKLGMNFYDFNRGGSSFHSVLYISEALRAENVMITFDRVDDKKIKIANQLDYQKNI